MPFAVTSTGFFALRFLFLQTHATSYVFLQTNATSYVFLHSSVTVHCKGESPIPISLWFKRSKLDVYEFYFWIQFQHFQHCAIGEAADEAVLNNLTEKNAYLGRLKYREACSRDHVIFLPVQR